MNDSASTSAPHDAMRSPHGGDPSPGPAVWLHLPAVPANVALVRQALAGFTDDLGLGGARAADMKIALTEACTNAVVHAYGEEGGPLEVTMEATNGRLVLGVRDRGPGLRPLPAAAERAPLGFGLALIASLSDEFGVAGGQHGTEVRMTFAFEDRDGGPPLSVSVPTEEAWPANDTTLVLAPGARAAPVLSRVVALIAARADFSIDRLSDAQIVSDAIAGAAGPYVRDDALRVAIVERDGSFDLVVGPLVAGGAARLVHDTDLPGLGCLLEHLADELRIEPLDAPGEGELLRATLTARH